MDELALRPAAELAAAVRSGAVRRRELVELYLERIERANGALNAWPPGSAPLRSAATAAARCACPFAAAGLIRPRFAYLRTIAFAAALGELTGGYRPPPAMAVTADANPTTGG